MKLAGKVALVTGAQQGIGAAIARALAGEGACSVIGEGRGLPLRDAAMVNAVLIHGLDFDDTHLASIIHPTCTSLPSALALGEVLDASGEDLLTAFLAGLDKFLNLLTNWEKYVSPLLTDVGSLRARTV